MGEWNWDLPYDTQEAIKRGRPLSGPVVKVIEIYYPVPDDYRGLYAEEVGYQRKGMIEGFYEEFDNGRCYVRLADVQRAATFLDLELWDEPEDVLKQQEKFDHWRSGGGRA